MSKTAKNPAHSVDPEHMDMLVDAARKAVAERGLMETFTRVADLQDGDDRGEYGIDAVFTAAFSDGVAEACRAAYDAAKAAEAAAKVALTRHAQLVRRQERDAERAALKAKGLRHCPRCGGAGGSNMWPGFICYGCNGSGIVPLAYRP